jgi:hypothetical protein
MTFSRPGNIHTRRFVSKAFSGNCRMEYPLHARKQSDEEMATKDRPMVPEKRSG